MEQYPIYSMEFIDEAQAEAELTKLGYGYKPEPVFEGEVTKYQGAEGYDIAMLNKVKKYNPNPEAEPEYNDGFLVDILCNTGVPLTDEQLAKLPLLDPQPNPKYRRHGWSGVQPLIAE